METLTVVGNQITRDSITYTLIDTQKVDDFMVHLIFDQGVIAFVGGNVTINGSLKNTADEIIAAVTQQ
jgi:hypothetical protein